MKLAVLGATGPSGQCIVEQALEAGHHVSALVRSPYKIKIQHENLQVLESNVFSGESLTKGMQGCDAVISCLGGNATLWSRVTLYTESIVPITAAMRACGINRLIVHSFAHSRQSNGENCCLVCIVRKTLLGTNLSNLAEMEDYLLDTCEDLMWTVVKPHGLNLKPLDSRHLAAFEGQCVPDSGWMLPGVPRANVAQFMLEQLTDNTWHNKMVAVTFLKEDKTQSHDKSA